MARDSTFYAAAERRIEYFAVALGAAGAIFAAIFWGGRAAAGVASGAALSWLNFRWMKQGVGALARLSRAQEGAEKVRAPKGVYARFLGRYALLALAAYVILVWLRVPVASLLAGFGAVAIAALAEAAGQLFRSERIPHANS
jgi:hypothetical protein